ncbi:hypothetical protein TNCV_775001 [Trichonephila clavipes]|nr:hypothetical protein TNCV_775001 [Trichonephila clavipes]
MSRSGGHSSDPVFKSPSKFGAHLSNHRSRDERLSIKPITPNKSISHESAQAKTSPHLHYEQVDVKTT